jgi:GT2 family glycosyltransferase
MTTEGNVRSVSIVVPTHRRPTTLRETLERFRQLDYPQDALEVIVVDDGPDEATAAVVESLNSDPTVPTKLLQQPGLGAATARNAGARLATGDVLLFCDDDMLLEPDHVKRHVETHERYGDVFVGGERWYSPSSLAAFEATPFGRFRVALERTFTTGRHELQIDGACVEAPTLPSCDLSVARASFWRLGGFDESFPYAGAEDQDLSARATRAGYRLIRNYEIRTLHNDPTTTLRQFCLREERGAHTVVALCQRFPEYLGRFSENNPVSSSDPLPLAAKKLLKSALSKDAPLAAVHGILDRLESVPLPDVVRWRLYRAVLGLHIFRGYRGALRAADQTSG